MQEKSEFLKAEVHQHRHHRVALERQLAIRHEGRSPTGRKASERSNFKVGRVEFQVEFRVSRISTQRIFCDKIYRMNCTTILATPTLTLTLTLSHFRKSSSQHCIPLVTAECTRGVIDPLCHSRHNGRDRQYLQRLGAM